MKILHFCLGLYNFWTTYEGEYLNESLMARPDVQLRMWGRDRLYYHDGMNAIDAVKHLYGNECPDVIIVHSTMQKHDNLNDRKLLEGLDILRNKSILIWRVFDCFDKRLHFYSEQIVRYKPHYALVWYPDQVVNLQNKVGGLCKVLWFPHSVGRRYFNKNSDRPYDLALIGRCDASASGFAGLKVYVPPLRSTRSEKGNNLVNDLNLCKFSWNVPALGQYATLRFVESPACGTVSAVPYRFAQLDLYYPEDCYLICGDDPVKKIQDITEEEYIYKQQRAYKFVMNNHTMDCRVEYLMGIINGESVVARDYYRYE